jgi:hypothetical protein
MKHIFIVERWKFYPRSHSSVPAVAFDTREAAIGFIEKEKSEGVIHPDDYTITTIELHES